MWTITSAEHMGNIDVFYLPGTTRNRGCTGQWSSELRSPTRAARRFRVTGIFDSGFYDYDENWCFMTLAAAEGLAGAGDLVNVLEFRLNQPERAAEAAEEEIGRASCRERV